MFRLMPLSVAAVVLVVPAAALAHHGWSAYDADKTLKITAPLTDVSSSFAMEQIKYTTALPLDHLKE